VCDQVVLETDTLTDLVLVIHVYKERSQHKIKDHANSEDAQELRLIWILKMVDVRAAVITQEELLLLAILITMYAARTLHVDQEGLSLSTDVA